MKNTTSKCICDIGGSNFAFSSKICPFKQTRKINPNDSSHECQWKTSNGECQYKANRRDLMKSLCQLTAKVFELSKNDEITPEMATHSCLLISLADEQLNKYKKQ